MNAQTSHFKSQAVVVAEHKSNSSCNENIEIPSTKSELTAVPTIPLLQPLQPNQLQQTGNDWNHVQVLQHIAMLQANQDNQKKSSHVGPVLAQSNDGNIQIRVL